MRDAQHMIYRIQSYFVFTLNNKIYLFFVVIECIRKRVQMDKMGKVFFSKRQYFFS